MRQTVGDMIRSMVVVLAVVVAILLVTWRPKPDPVRVVDITPALVAARSAAPFTIETPALVDLRPTSARWEPTPASDSTPVWHLGYVTPQEEYLQVSQAMVSGDDFIAEQTAQGVAGETVMISGVEWRVYSSPDRISVVRTLDGVTTVVSGTDVLEQIMTAAGSLRAGA